MGFGAARDFVPSEPGATEWGYVWEALDKTMGHSACMVEIQRTRTLFKYAYDEGLIDRPVRYGTRFAPGTFGPDNGEQTGRAKK